MTDKNNGTMFFHIVPLFYIKKNFAANVITVKKIRLTNVNNQKHNAHQNRSYNRA
jgi:hypothetical protein